MSCVDQSQSRVGAKKEISFLFYEHRIGCVIHFAGAFHIFIYEWRFHVLCDVCSQSSVCDEEIVI